MDHAGFLGAIAAAPGEVGPRLIYADWLDEIADPRAGLIRAEEAMKHLAPASDEYWHHKPLCDVSRPFASDEWLHALGYDLPRPVLAHGWPDDWKGRWRVMKALIGHWLGAPLPDVGSPTGRVRRIEARAGVELPASVRELLAVDGRMRMAGRAGWLAHWFEPELQTEPPAFLLGRSSGEREGVAFEDFGEPDPPVTWFDAPGSGLDCYPRGRRVTDWVWDLFRLHRAATDLVLVQAHPRMREPAEAAFGPLVRTPGCWVGERPGLWLQWNDRGGVPESIEILASPRLPDEAVPAWVWQLTREPMSHTSGRFGEVGAWPADIPF